MIPKLPFGATCIRISHVVPAGLIVCIGDMVITRHMSELMLVMAGARWHPEGHRCPTWTDATECRCMLGGES